MTETRDAEGGEAGGGPTRFDNVLLEVARRLRSPPLLGAFGIVVVMAVVAGIGIDAVAAVTVPVVVVAVVALVAWAIVEVVRTRARRSGHVTVKGRRLGQDALVTGVDNAPADRPLPDTRVISEDLDDGARVTGVSYVPRSGGAREQSE